VSEAERIEFVRCCAFCGGVMDSSVPEVLVSVPPRRPPAVSYVGHTECFRRALSPMLASGFDPADARPSRFKPGAS
jgi:hypothetical protein